MKLYILEEWNNLFSKDLSCAEALRVQHDLGDELAVWFGHGQAAEQLLQIVWEVGSASVARIHGDENGHVWADLHLLIQELSGDWHTCKDERNLLLKLINLKFMFKINLNLILLNFHVFGGN